MRINRKIKRWNVGLALALQAVVITTALPSSPPASAASPLSRTAVTLRMLPLRYGQLAPLGVVDLRTLQPRAPAAACGPGDLPANVIRTSGATGAPVPAGLSLTPAVTRTLKLLTHFPAMDESGQVNDFPTDASQATEPPDTQLAAGPTALLEMDNRSGSEWSISGTLLNDFDLNTFFPFPTGYCADDPRDLYDAASRRFFATALGVDTSTNNSQIYLLVSTNSDPAGWTPYLISTNTVGVLEDQPKLGLNNDKVVVSWNDYGPSGGGAYIGQETIVLQKSDLLAGTPAAYAAFGPDSTHFGLVPSQSLSSTSIEYVASDSANTSLQTIAISGTPRLANVEWDETDLPITAPLSPPPAPQAGVTTTVNTGDSRLESAVWQNGILWTAGNDGCVPPHDAATRACLFLTKIKTPATGPALIASFSYGVANTYLYYPAVTMDNRNNAVITYSYSSATTDPSLGLIGLTASAGAGQVLGPKTIESINQPYNGGRWGDYSGAARDANDVTKVWVAGELAVTPTVGAPNNWGTDIGEATVQ